MQADLTALSIAAGDWSYTNLRHSILKGLNLQRVRFIEADLYGCNLENADLREADLTKANLAQAILTGADLRDAVIDGIDFKSFDLKGVRLDVAQAIQVARTYGAEVG